MTGSYLPIAVTALIGGLLTMDRMAVGQFSLSRPLFAAALLGYVLHCPAEGAFIGIIYELLFLRSIPAGSFVPFHPLHGSLIAVLLVASSPALGTGWTTVPAAVFFSLPAVQVDRFFEILWRRSNDRNLIKASALVRMSKIRNARGVHILSILKAPMFHACSLLLTGIILSAIFSFTYNRFPNFFTYLSVAGLAPFFAGLAGVVSGRKFGYGRVGFLSGLLLGALAGSGILL